MFFPLGYLIQDPNRRNEEQRLLHYEWCIEA